MTFPEAGSFRWSMEQGPFAGQDLGTVTVAPSGGATTGTTAASSEPAWSPTARWLLTLTAPTMVGLLSFDVTRNRRRIRPA